MEVTNQLEAISQWEVIDSLGVLNELIILISCRLWLQSDPHTEEVVFIIAFDFIFLFHVRHLEMQESLLFSR